LSRVEHDVSALIVVELGEKLAIGIVDDGSFAASLYFRHELGEELGLPGSGCADNQDVAGLDLEGEPNDTAAPSRCEEEFAERRSALNVETNAVGFQSPVELVPVEEFRSAAYDTRPSLMVVGAVEVKTAAKEYQEDGEAGVLDTVENLPWGSSLVDPALEQFVHVLGREGAWSEV
jgi:hypothetical protein